MQKRFLTLAALALGAGCTSSPGPAPVNLNLYWHFVGAQGQVYGSGSQANPGCAEAGVDTVLIQLTDPYGYFTSPSFSCVRSNGVPGASYAGVNGLYSWTVTGYRGGLRGTAVYSVTQTNQNVVGDSTGNAIVDVELAALYIDQNVSYSLPSGTTCESAGITGMSFELDQSGSLYYTNAGTSAFPVACGDTTQDNFFTVPSLPPGGYSLLFVSALGPSGSAAYATCDTSVVQPSASPGQTFASSSVPTLAVPTLTCP